jgi:hypothetical protein
MAVSGSDTPFPLGAYLGNPDNSSQANEATFETNYDSFSQLMGVAPQYLVLYVDGTQSVSEWTSNNAWLASSAAASPDAKDVTPVIGLPMASSADSSMSADSYYKAFASGQYDSMIEQLVKTWASNGYTTQYWRPGWEMNLTSSLSYAGSDAQTQADWVAAFQHIYTVLHDAGQADGVNIQVIWNPSVTNYSDAEAITDLYPGNNYVDIIGADVYGDMYPYSLYDWDKNDGTIDSSLSQWMADPVNREHYWTYPAATPYSLDGSEGHSLSLVNLLQFAEQQGKPFAIPETGAGNSDGGHDVADDAAFPQWLAQTLDASGAQIAFVNLWDSNGGGNYEFSFSADDKPLEAAAWAANFGTADATCFLAGTRLQSFTGETAVEALRPGDLVATRVAGKTVFRPVIWIGHRRVGPRDTAASIDAYPIRIRANAFAHNVPSRDLLVTSDHCIFADGKLVPARMLVNHASIIVDTSIIQYRFFHVELETHAILVAENLETESYLDTGNRGNFANALVSALRPSCVLNQYHKTWENDAAAPLAVDRDTVEPIWRRLATRASRLGFAATRPAARLVHGPDLRLVTEAGVEILPSVRDGKLVTFTVPADAGQVRLRTRASRPSDTIGPYVDDRRELGVLVGGIVCEDGHHRTSIYTHLSCSSLDGWHAPEPGSPFRWTNGNAMLPAEIMARQHGPLLLSIEVVHGGPYLMPDAAEAPYVERQRSRPLGWRSARLGPCASSQCPPTGSAYSAGS